MNIVDCRGRSWLEAISIGIPSQYATSRMPMTNDGFVNDPVRIPAKPWGGSPALSTQVGGTHYKTFKIQPAEYIHANSIGFLEGNAIKYISRWRLKGGVADLDKAIHCIQLLKELENGTPSVSGNAVQSS